MSDYITSDHVATTDEMRKAYMGSGPDAAPKHLVFNRWLAFVEAAAEQRGAKAERERIAREIEALEHTREEVQDRIRDGYSVDWSSGFDSAVFTAARIARKGA